ncbi:MAG: hypothetical protein KGH58_01305 [Candidatus Micrarchaeota archaeon]|nr:hypothetical protein [Candidatus Micrarchaeota archaeon]
MQDIDDVMRDVQDRERRDSGGEVERDSAIGNLDYEEKAQRPVEPSEAQAARRINIGRVEHFFNKINVVAMHLTGTLRVGDTIEIDGPEGRTRARVSEMQIDRKDVEVASYGDDVGVKVEGPVSEGSEVYLIG